MAKRRTFFDYLIEAFHVRYPVAGLGQVPVNYLAVGGAILAGLWQWPLFLVGAGLEAGFLSMLASNPRFHRYVETKDRQVANGDWKQQVESMLRGLSFRDRKRYHTLAERCESVSKLVRSMPSAALAASSMTFQNINALLWIYLKLLVQKNTIEQYVETRTQAEADIRADMQEAERKLGELQDDQAMLKKSVGGTLELLKRRLHNVIHAKDKLDYLEAELDRIDHQVEWLVEETALNEGDSSLSERIDSVASTLNETNNWMQLNVDFAVPDFEAPDLLSQTGKHKRLTME